jgi:hypothetical protein
MALKLLGSLESSGGNVGIGTTSPTQKLDVTDGDFVVRDSAGINKVTITRFGGIELKGNGTGSRTVGTPNTDALSLATNNTSRIYITSAGNVGIGTTSPYTKLVVGSRGTAAATSILAYDGIAFDFYNDGSPYKRHGVIISQAADASESVLDFNTKAASGTNSTKMTILGNGNVGIGTTSPGNRLRIDAAAGQATTLANSITNAAVYINSDTGNGSNNIRIGESGNGSYFLQVSNSAGTSPYDINLNPFGGNVGIGTTSPGTKLHVAGNLLIGSTYTQPSGSVWTTSNSQLILGGAHNAEVNDDNPGVKLLITGYDNDLSTAIYPIYAEDENGLVDFWIKNRQGASNGPTMYFAGNVGIGTTSPSTKLDVNGVITATSGNSSNWNTAYGWGNHAGLYLGATAKAADSNLLDGIDSGSFLRSDAADTATGEILFDAGFKSDPIMLSGSQNFDNISRSGFYNLYNTSTGSTNSPGFPYGTMIVVGNNKQSQGFGFQLAHERLNTAGNFKVRGMNDSASAWSSWATVWTSLDFANNSANWNTAYTDRNKWDGGSTGLNAATGRTSLGLGTLATLSTVNAATITDNSVGAAELNVTGNGSNGQVLTSDGDGTFSWTAKTTNTDTITSVGLSGSETAGTVTLTGAGATTLTQVGGTIEIRSTDTNTTYTVGDGGLTQKNFTTTLQTKLDGIEAGANVTDTANVVAALTAGTNVSIAANGTISATDTNTTYSAGTGLALSGTTFKLKGGEIPGSADLNHSSYRATGVYSQNSDLDAVSGSNYPVALAGMLEVWNDDYGNGLHCLQRYSQYNSTDVYQRNYYNGNWSAWRNLTQDTNTTYSVGDNGLTQKNFTTTLNTKLDGIAASANNYSLPAGTSLVRGRI